MDTQENTKTIDVLYGYYLEHIGCKALDLNSKIAEERGIKPASKAGYVLTLVDKGIQHHLNEQESKCHICQKPVNHQKGTPNVHLECFNKIEAFTLKQ